MVDDMTDHSELGKYPAKAHAKRVADCINGKSGLIYLHGAKSTRYNDTDTPKPFRQERFFFYLTGCNENDCHVTYEMGTGKLILWLRPFTVLDAIYRGRGSSLQEAMDKYDIDEARYSDKLWDYFLEWPNNSPVHILHSGYKYTPPHGPRNLSWGKRIESSELLPALVKCRIIKDLFEVEMIKEANKISAIAHREVLKGLRTFKSETQVAATFVGTSMIMGAPVQAYDPIAASGTNGAVLHYGANDEPLEGRQSMVLDAGAEYNLYASDVTRSFPLSGHWSTEGAAIYALVADMQSSAMARLGPGVHFAVVQALCHLQLIRGLKALGILLGEEKELFESAISLAFLPHGIGHHIGLDVHDLVLYERQTHLAPKISAMEAMEAAVPYSTKWLEEFARVSAYRPPTSLVDEPLRPGMVITVEPGIYFHRYALENVNKHYPKFTHAINWKLLEKYYPVGGVRIEDDILITESGWQNLTTAPKGEEALRIIRGKK